MIFGYFPTYRAALISTAVDAASARHDRAVTYDAHGNYLPTPTNMEAKTVFYADLDRLTAAHDDSPFSYPLTAGDALRFFAFTIVPPVLLYVVALALVWLVRGFKPTTAA